MNMAMHKDSIYGYGLIFKIKGGYNYGRIYNYKGINHKQVK